MQALTWNVGMDILTVGIEGKEMANSSVISTKGQVTVPKEIRTRLGLRVGDRVEFVVRGKETVIRPARAAGNPFEKYIGVLGPFPGGLEGINAWVRSMRDDEESSGQ
jgi:antitoxin PrlF